LGSVNLNVAIGDSAQKHFKFLLYWLKISYPDSNHCSLLNSRNKCKNILSSVEGIRPYNFNSIIIFGPNKIQCPSCLSTCPHTSCPCRHRTSL